ncbi:hypothetical protein P775_03810 [Puniceibacterium antarcticum]|uniref:Periplasmic protein-like protein n=1 Tax=Puniceibacterium antarcticum TaxID=1206336 RepID=A0A2G8RJ32_9RHOB|nr:hypothetical protein [Puniceibacterium antarcticum]PIL21560.1 hypothetical protein P775_03810 [Puniceibacterium antarcticum]
MRGISVPRILTGALVVQLIIGALLVLGDVRDGGFHLPGFGPAAPRLTEPVRPGDQRRTFNPSRDRPPTSPLRDAGTLPDRLTLTQEDGSLWRLEGGIEPGDASRIIAQIDAAEPAIQTLILQSPGGAVSDALDLGRHLRAQGLATRMLDGEYCYSACPYMLAGGATRDIATGASVGVHQHYFGQNTLLPAFVAVEDIQRGQGEVMIYLQEMGIDPLVMQHALTTPSDEIYVLLPEELEQYGFIQTQD